MDLGIFAFYYIGILNKYIGILNKDSILKADSKACNNKGYFFSITTFPLCHNDSKNTPIRKYKGKLRQY